MDTFQGPTRFPVVRLQKRVSDLSPSEPAFPIRTYQDGRDSQAWLRIVNSAFGRVAPRKPWTEREFRRELTNRAWWRPDLCFFALHLHQGQPIGCVAIELNCSQDFGQLHWLAVEPVMQGQGVGRALLAVAENRCRDAKLTRIIAETLAGWSTAVQFYLRNGYTADSLD